jgi:hypothetical protein
LLLLRFLSSKPGGLLSNLPANVVWNRGADADDRHGILGEAELDVLPGRQSSLQVPAHAQLYEAIEALGRRRKDVGAEVRAILVARDAPDPADGGCRERAEPAIAGRSKDDAGAGVDLPVRDPLADLLVVVLV